jgi:serine carboxypeptidase-like clade II
MNGGPGCASKIGLLNEIAPFLLPIDKNYTSGQSLLSNSYSWLNLTNLLFIDGPVGVGFSPNNDPDFVYNDKNTAKDNLDALLNFFSTDKFPEYKKSEFYLTG